MAIPAVTSEERALIKSYLLLMFIHKVFERDCRIIQESGVFKTPQLYVEVVGNGAKRAAVLLREVKQEFAKRAIKVFDIGQGKEGIEARYACRGYIGSINILWPSFREEMMDRMRAYLNLPTSEAEEGVLTPAEAAPVR
ncbi:MULTISPECIES: hypothetical protein [Paenibacillus]|jgi:hypothetical protein|uniref:Uncharacterized protein n=1 Tax=Paenibacillus lactis TaxID=228574 RepID=A0ABS4FBW5_9BACL|nr:MULTISPECIES: hypothetical protein [Paenibacillus]MBP1893537.1 hypothetical protein [Paenibacillus lactis]HAF98505.1 hypothetical protein [Paenibacillus lactis]